MRLLIVDDSAPVRQFMRQLVAPVATDVCECEDGSEALACYRAFHPDYVLMDLEMKRVNGMEAAAAILAAHPDAKIAIVTNFNDEMLRTRAKAAGAQAYIVKEQMTELARIVQGLPSNQNLL